MDPRSPIPHVVHEPFDGEHLTRSRFAADRPFFATPVESLMIVLTMLAALGAVLWMFCKTGGAV